MPLYEYRCRACETRSEVLQRMGEDAEGLPCPECGEAELERLLSTFAAGRSEGSTASATSTGAQGGDCGRPGCGSGFT